MSVREAGRHGGLALGRRYGVAHYRRIGRAGGVAFARRHGGGLARALRLRGGERVRERYGRAHYQSIGRVGGETTRQRHGDELYPRLGRMIRDRYGADHYARLSALSAATLSYLVGLQAARLTRGMTYAGLARQSGVSREAIKGFERLERGARWATVMKLADALGIQPADLTEEVAHRQLTDALAS
jgi:DNA-binding XRE family transcriptional regulator